jgi:hypothetical protein
VVAQGDFVGLGDVVSLDGSQSVAEALASLPQELEGVGGGAVRGRALGIGSVFFDEVCLQGRRNFVGRLQCVIDGPVPCGVVNHVDSILPQSALQAPDVARCRFAQRARARLDDLGRGLGLLVMQIPLGHRVPLLVDAAHQVR